MKSIYLYLFILLQSYSFVYSQSNTIDYGCANAIVTKLAIDVSNLPYNSTTSKYDFCSSSGLFNCDYLLVSIESIALTQTNTETLYHTDLSCFAKLKFAQLTKVHISTDFIQNFNQTLVLNDCFNATSLSTTVASPYLTIVNSASFTGNISLSSFMQYGIFELQSAQSIFTMDTQIDNDLAYKLTMDRLYSYTNSIPNFDNVKIYEADLYLTPKFQTKYLNTFSNFNTFKNILDFYLYFFNPIQFPLALFTTVGSNMLYLGLDGVVETPATELVIDNNQSKIRELHLWNIGSIFHINNKIPIKSFGTTIKRFTVNGGNYIGEKNFNKFNKLTDLTITDSKYTFKLPRFTNQILNSLDLGGNALTGTIDDSFCTIPDIDFRNNQLTGSLPSCFSCHVGEFSLKFTGNSITGLSYPYPACTTIQINIYVDRVNKRLIMYGQDLGFDKNNFHTTGFIGTWELVVPSYRFEANYDDRLDTLPKDNIIRVSWNSISAGLVKNVNISQTSPPPDCFRECTIGEYCDLVSHRCICSPGWSGDDCSINNNFYATSTSQVGESGGMVTLYGWFTNVHNSLSVSIGGTDCKIVDVATVTNTSIQCLVVPGTGTKSVTILQNDDSWSGKDIFTYSTLVKKCPKDCSSHGICSTTSGECKCDTGYTGFDCSILNIGGPNSNTTIDGNGTTVIVNEKTSYQILITHLIEVDFNNNPINTHILEKNWIKEKTDSSSSGSGSGSGSLSNDNINEFSQNINQSLTTCRVSYTIEEVQDEVKNYQFAGYDLSLVKGNVKISVLIYNYQYASTTNSLQLLFKSSVGTLDNGDGGDCNDQDTQIENNNDEQLLNYVTIKKDSKILQARFLNRIESDGRGTSITSTIVNTTNSGSGDDEDSITIALNLPHCSTCLIDPDFSVLVSPDFKTCDSNSRPAYLIPVVVVAGVVAIGLAVGAFILVKRKRIESDLQNKLKTFNNKA